MVRDGGIRELVLLPPAGHHASRAGLRRPGVGRVWRLDTRPAGGRGERDRGRRRGMVLVFGPGATGIPQVRAGARARLRGVVKELLGFPPGPKTRTIPRRRPRS